MPTMTKDFLVTVGWAMITKFCNTNKIVKPDVHVMDGRPVDGVCGRYYRRHNKILIWPRACAALGQGGRSWSVPGYPVDRTPVGVLCHELGHHVDRNPGRPSRYWPARTREEPVTSYAPDNGEWFAEMFKLFMTNPDLLRLIRPRTYDLMGARWTPIEDRPWNVVLAAFPRQLEAAARRINKASK